jgi:two-component system, LytTR family, response regulator
VTHETTYRPLRTLIVEGDASARARIISLLAGESDIAVVGECGDGEETVQRILQETPDLLFMNVQLPRLDAFQVVHAVGAARMPVTIFVTAYAELALQAYDAGAVGCLFKPIEKVSFQLALARARSAALSRRAGVDPGVSSLLALLHAPERVMYPEVIAIKTGDRFRFLEVDEIDYVEAEGNYIRFSMGRTQSMVHKSLSEAETRLLDPRRFVRIHRSTIVNLSRIAFAEPMFRGELSVGLRDGTRLVCSRRFRSRLQERVPFTT